MKRKTRTILLIITIILIMVVGFLAYRNMKETGKVNLIIDHETPNWTDNYCEYSNDTGIDTCLPADKCAMQTDSDGREICMARLST